ncbi:MAG: L,D-transpeptidase family protein [Nanoarchaeota archaeon]
MVTKKELILLGGLALASANCYATAANTPNLIATDVASQSAEQKPKSNLNKIGLDSDKARIGNSVLSPTFDTSGTPSFNRNGKKTSFLNNGKPLQDLIDAHCQNKEQRKIVAYKSARFARLYCDDVPLKEYQIALGTNPVGPKLEVGDGKMPEGEYFVKLKYQSRFHKSLRLAYPNLHDAEQGLNSGLLSNQQYYSILASIKQCREPDQNTRLGGLVELHGGGANRRDWTLGCIAFNNDAIDEIFDFYKTGCNNKIPNTTITIKP